MGTLQSLSRLGSGSESMAIKYTQVLVTANVTLAALSEHNEKGTKQEN